MRYEHNRELLRQLAAEYVIGTLRGAARRRFEAVLAQSEDARFQRDFWEQRLAEFGQIVRPVQPPATTRELLLRVAAAPQITSTSVCRPRQSWRRRRRALWTYAAGFATAAALVAAFFLGQHWMPGDLATTPRSTPGGMASRAAAGPSPEDLQVWPIYAAQVRMPASSMGWLLSVTPDHRQIIATAADDFFQAGRAELHLWCMVRGSPVSLGVLPSERHASVSFDIPASVRGQTEVTFAISLEPQGRARGGGPTAPVLNQSPTLLDEI